MQQMASSPSFEAFLRNLPRLTFTFARVPNEMANTSAYAAQPPAPTPTRHRILHPPLTATNPTLSRRLREHSAGLNAPCAQGDQGDQGASA